MINIYKDIDYHSILNEIIKEIKYMKSNKFSYKNKRVVERKIIEKKEEKKVENNDKNKEDQKQIITKKKVQKY